MKAKLQSTEELDYSRVRVKFNSHPSLALMDIQTTGGDLINAQFVHQQHYTTSEENNLVYDPQLQEKTSIPPAPTATRHCNFCKGEGYYASTCEAKCKSNAELRYRIMPASNMAKIYLNLEDGPKDDPDFYLIAHVDKDDRMRDAYVVGIRICPMLSQLYNAPEGKKGVSKDNGFLYKKNEKGEWRLGLPSTFDINVICKAR